MKSKNGFTLLEVMGVIFIGALMMAIVMAGFSTFNSRYVLKGDTEMLKTVLQDARAKTILGKEGLQYGVRIGSSTLSLFTGSVFDQNNVVSTTDLNSKVGVGVVDLNGGGYDVVFTKLKGTTNNFGTTTLYLIDDPSTFRSVIIKESGNIEIN